jgi:hypothetical protein
MPSRRKELEPGASLLLTMRLEPELATRLDGFVDSLAQATGLTVIRTDVVRMLLKEALDARDARPKHKK